MKKKLKVLPVLGALSLLIALTSIPVSADEVVHEESTLLLQEGGLFETSYSEKMPIYEATVVDESFDKQIADSCKSFATTIDVSKFNISVNDIASSYFNVINNHPELFYVDGWVSWYSSNDYATKIVVRYKYTQDEVEPMIEEFDAVVDNILAGVDESWSEAEKALYIHEYLTLNTAYTYGYSDAYNLLVNNRGVCQAYALSNKYLLNQLGINARMVSSSDLNHAWNLVEIDDKWYYTDVTWDDPYPNIDGYSGHKNFLRSCSGLTATGHTSTDWTSDGSNVYNFDTSTYYDDYFWNSIKLPLYETKGVWLNKISNEIYAYSFEENNNQLLTTIDYTWYYIPGTPGSYYNGAFSGFGFYDDRIFYNSPNTVYSIDTNSLILGLGTAEPIEEYVLPDYSKGQIFDFYFDPSGYITLKLRDNYDDDTIENETIQLVERNTLYRMDTVAVAEAGSTQKVFAIAKDLSKCRVKLGASGTAYAFSTNNVDVTIPAPSSTTELEWYYSVDSGKTWTASGIYTWVLVDYSAEVTVSPDKLYIDETATAQLVYKNWIPDAAGDVKFRFILMNAADVDTDNIYDTDTTKALWYSGDVTSDTAKIAMPSESGEYAVIAFANVTIGDNTLYMYPVYKFIKVEELLATRPVITSAVGGEGAIDIEWTPVANATNYRIFTILNGKFTKVGDTANTSYTITGLKGSTTYGILVRSYANGVWSDFTEADYATAKTNGEVYTKPVITSAVGGDGTIDIEWTPVENAVNYRIFTILNGKFTKIGDTANISYTITGLNDSTTYGILVRSYANGAWSAYTEADYATAKTNGEVYTKPVITSAVGGDGKIDIEWTPVENAANYRIFTILNGKFTKIGDTANTAYTITGLKDSTTYGILVRSYANGAWSAYTEADYATAKTNGEVYTKPVITSAVGGDGTIDIEWTAVDNASVYRIFIIVNGQFTKIGDTSNTSYTITGLENSTPYGVLVRSYANGVWSEYSSADYATVVL